MSRVFQGGIELNWLPPTKPNGEVHYVIYYTPEGGTEQSIDTGSDLTHYNLTGLERNRVYTNIAVQAVNSAGRSERSAAIAQYSHIPLGEHCANNKFYKLRTVYQLQVVQLWIFIENSYHHHTWTCMHDIFISLSDASNASSPGPSRTSGNVIIQNCIVHTLERY